MDPVDLAILLRTWNLLTAAKLGLLGPVKK
jgi:hypothetical protein